MNTNPVGMTAPSAEMKRQLDVHDCLFRDVANFIVFNQIPGDYVEFGVYKGESINRVRHWLYVQWHEFTAIREYHDVMINYDHDYISRKRVFAFDSFRGLPQSIDVSRPIHFTAGIYAATVEEFLQNVQSANDQISVIPVPGWFEDTLNAETKKQVGLTQAAAIFVDCDLRESAEHIFPFITDLIQDGTVIIIDDWFRYNGHPRRGVQGAFNQWRATLPNLHCAELCRSGANRIAFVCHWLV